MIDDPFKLERFLSAQSDVFEQVLDELHAGQKRTHWIWFIFPQMKGLGRSSQANYFGIGSLEEAVAYLRHPVLGARLVQCTRLVTHIEGHGMSDHVVIYAGLSLGKEIQKLNPKLKVMPEAGSVENAKHLIERLHPSVIAFDAGDFTPEIIRVVKEASAQIYVDRMGKTDAPAGWQSAIEAGADGIQTDHPAELVQYLREKGYKKP